MNLTLSVVLAIAGAFLLLLGITGGDFDALGKIKVPKISTWARVVSFVVGLLLIGAGIWFGFLQSPGNSIQETSKSIGPVSLSTKSKYSFEDGSMGWIPQDYENSRAVVQVFQSDETAKEGQYSLKMLVELLGGDAHKSQGEVWVNMQNNPPNGEQIPIDLNNRTVTAWVHAPQGSTGDTDSPNGFQLFVKDENWKSLYGSWHNVVEDDWVQISLIVSDTKPTDGWIDSGFDPSQIIAIGVKIGSGGDSTAKYEGPVYIDAIDW